jgi:hypothetical protein
MNALLRLTRPAAIGFSTDYTASRVHRFVSLRPSISGRPETDDRSVHVGPSMPLQVLYPSLYAERFSTAQRCRHYVRAIAINLSNRLAHRDGHSPTIAPSALQAVGQRHVLPTMR